MRTQEEKNKLEELRGTPLAVGNLEEIIGPINSNQFEFYSMTLNNEQMTITRLCRRRAAPSTMSISWWDPHFLSSFASSFASRFFLVLLLSENDLLAINFCDELSELAVLPFEDLRVHVFC